MVKGLTGKQGRGSKAGGIVPVGAGSAGGRGGECGLRWKRVRASVELSALSEVFAGLEMPSILGGNAATADGGGFSYWLSNPVEVFEFRAGQSDPFGGLGQTLERYRLQAVGRAGLPKGMFCGGWVGFFSYELGRYIDGPAGSTIDDLGMPLIRLCLYDRLVCYDHGDDSFVLVALGPVGDEGAIEAKLAGLERLLVECEKRQAARPREADIERVDLSLVRCNMSKEYYLETVDRIKRNIYDGDVYQVNFSQRFVAGFEGRGVDLFHWQNAFNPSAYAAYIDTGGFKIVSSSPEMFITISDGRIATRPIKGTRARAQEKSEAARRANRTSFDDLLNSEKDKSELNMIIDLERNDIARVCVPGSRRVTEPRAIETCSTVFHAAATIGGVLREDADFCAIMRAMFPGGSITGAPKIRAMEIIDAAEPTARGVYTGSIGFIGLDGTVCLNIAIRTVIICGHQAFVQVGGGIVADSDPHSEWHETITKARALLAGIRAVNGDAG